MIIVKILICLVLLFNSFIILFILFLNLSKLRISFSYKNKKFQRLSNLIFAPYSLFPKDRNFFKNFNPREYPLRNTKLPKLNLNDYDFDKVNLYGCKFNKKSVLPLNLDFFQNVYNHNLRFCTLPEGDYSNYNLDGIDIAFTTFYKKSKLPKKYNLFKSVGSNYFLRTKFPDEFYENCHLYDLSNICLIENGGFISIYQYYILYKKYGEKVYDFNFKIKDV